MNILLSDAELLKNIIMFHYSEDKRKSVMAEEKPKLTVCAAIYR